MPALVVMSLVKKVAVGRIIKMEKFDKFCNRFDMRVRSSNQRLRRFNRQYMAINPWSVTISDDALYQDMSMNIEEVECVEILMPRDRIEQIEFLLEHYEAQEERLKQDQALLVEYRSEQRIRNEYPVVDKAYQQYRTLLNLCKEK